MADRCLTPCLDLSCSRHSQHARQQPPTSTPEPVASVGEEVRWAGSPTHVALWDAINDYAATCGGDPSKHVYGNTSRMRAVADVEKAAATLRSEIADLRGKLERAERATSVAVDAHKWMTGQRDAATARATEAERRLAEVCDAREHGIGRVITENRLYLSTLPGSKDGE